MDLRQTQNKRFMKNKDTACYCQCCRNTIPAVSLRVSSLRFLHGSVFGTRRFGSTSLLSTSCPVVIEEDPRRAVARHRYEIWLWVLLDKYRAGLQLLPPQVWEMCFVIYYQDQKKKRWENVIFTIHVLSRLTALLTWAASLGWTSAVTCCSIYREYHEPVVFTLSSIVLHRFRSSHHFILF